MKVLLKQDVENLGLAGEVYDVAGGYGRNYLVPQGYAVKASPGAMNQAEIWRKKAEARRAEIRAEFEALAVKIEEISLSYTARASETGKLFGSITTAQIADDLNSDNRLVNVRRFGVGNTIEGSPDGTHHGDSKNRLDRRLSAAQVWHCHVYVRPLTCVGRPVSVGQLHRRRRK